MVADQACNQEFFRTEGVSWNKATSRNISTTTNKQTNKSPYGENLGFLILNTPKTAFLMRNLPRDSRNLGIFLNKQVAPFNFQNRAKKASLSSLVLCSYWRILRFLCFLPKNAHEVFRVCDSYFEWRVKYNEPGKTNFVNEFIEVGRTLSTYIHIIFLSLAYLFLLDL